MPDLPTAEQIVDVLRTRRDDYRLIMDAYLTGTYSRDRNELVYQVLRDILCELGANEEEQT